MNDSLQFILAGNALFTVENVATGNRFTFMVRQPDDDKPHFVSVLTGPDNESDYAFLGTVFEAARYHHGRRSRIAEMGEPCLIGASTWRHRRRGAGLFRSMHFGHLPAHLDLVARRDLRRRDRTAFRGFFVLPRGASADRSSTRNAGCRPVTEPAIVEYLRLAARGFLSRELA